MPARRVGMHAWTARQAQPASRDQLLPLSLNISISRVQNFAHNISIPMDKDKNKGVGGWVESWWIV
jgi:hypothetical protein